MPLIFELKKISYLIADQTSITPRIHTNSTSNCYSIQEGRIIEKRPRSRYISPARTKNKTLCPLFSNTSTPLAKKIFQQQKKSNINRTDEPDQINGTLVADEEVVSIKSTHEKRIPDIIRREKRNPLASTRLSCYKPKLSGEYNLLHCKSVEDFMFLNADDTASTFSDHSGDTTTLISDHADDWEHASNPPKTVNKDSEEISGCIVTKSVQSGNLNANNTKNITPIMASKKKIGPGNLSERFKTMSSRTQKIFSRLYKHSSHSTGKDSVADEFVAIRAKPFMGPENSITGPNSRRSLSYGNLPALDHFQRNLEAFESNVIKIDIKDATSDNHSFDSDLVCDETNQTDVLTEDADSGILVNESGQSSIIVVEPEEIANGGVTNRKVDNFKVEYKFVELRLDDDDIDRSLRVVLRPQHFDGGKRLGYQVADIIPGGLIDR